MAQSKVEGLQTAQEAITAAGLDWQVELKDVFMSKPLLLEVCSYEPIKNYKAVQRVTDGQIFAIVGERYRPVQNRDAFRFFDSVIGQGQAVYETAGSLRKGAVTWIMANLQNSLSIAGEEVKEYLTLVNSHDGSSALQMFYTPVRVVCMNTLQMASSGAADKFYARHTESIDDKVREAQWILGFADKWFGKFADEARYLAAKMLPAPEMPKLLIAAFSQKDSKRMEDVWPPIRAQMDRVRELVYVGRGNDNPKIQGTAWQAFQGISQYVDYEKPVKGQGNRDRRLTSAWFGSGAKVKSKAWDYLLKV